jgi:hypothetical protein
MRTEEFAICYVKFICSMVLHIIMQSLLFTCSQLNLLEYISLAPKPVISFYTLIIKILNR